MSNGWGRRFGALQLALSIVAPSLIPFVGTNAVLVILAVGNALGGIAHIYGYHADQGDVGGGPQG